MRDSIKANWHYVDLNEGKYVSSQLMQAYESQHGCFRLDRSSHEVPRVF